jgi:hypothetical protein
MHTLWEVAGGHPFVFVGLGVQPSALRVLDETIETVVNLAVFSRVHQANLREHPLAHACKAGLGGISEVPEEKSDQAKRRIASAVQKFVVILIVMPPQGRCGVCWRRCSNFKPV